MVVAWLFFLASCIGVLFWRSEWKYSLPTPLPAHYHEVARGTSVALPKELSQRSILSPKGVFLHFFNPDCPCSRFNMPVFRSLVQQYGQQVRFAIVLMTDKQYTDGQIRARFDLPPSVPVLRDTTLAARCGVYSTPQAVIIDAHENLFYRGNYNRARYCTDEKTGFAKIALEGLLHNDLAQSFSPLALKAYGCQLPTCKQ